MDVFLNGIEVYRIDNLIKRNFKCVSDLSQTLFDVRLSTLLQMVTVGVLDTGLDVLSDEIIQQTILRVKLK